MLTEIIVGVITRAHGVRGEVVVDLRTDEPERRFAPGEVLHSEQGGSTFTVLRTREHQNRWLVSFAEIGNRDVAEAARGVRLVAEVPVDQRPVDEEEYYDRQLVGLNVFAGDDAPVGSVKSVLHLPAQDVLEIATANGDRLVPFVAELVPTVDLAAGRIVLAPVAGLLDDPDEIGEEDR
jgi:16S rRNA processing protein RimM